MSYNFHLFFYLKRWKNFTKGEMMRFHTSIFEKDDEVTAVVLKGSPYRKEFVKPYPSESLSETQ